MKILFCLTLFFTLLFSSCHKKKDDPDPNGTGTTITSYYYFQATIDGNEIVFQDGVNGYGSGAGLSEISTPTGYSEEQSMNLIKPFSTIDFAGAIIVKKFTSAPSACSEIENMFYTGSYSYGKLSTGTLSEPIDGVVVYYVDGNGVQWSSDLGAATQTGSTFQITEHINNSDGYSQKKTKATFSCTLYDGMGNSKNLTSGTIRSRSVQCDGI